MTTGNQAGTPVSSAAPITAQAGQEVLEEEVPRTIDERMDAIEGVVMELIDKLEGMTKQLDTVKKTAVTKPKGLFGGKRTPTPMKDLKTGTVYPSKASVGKNFGTEAGGDPLDTMVYYTVLKKLKMPDGSDRFVEASPEEGEKARAAYKAQVEADVVAMNAKLAAEQAAADAAAAKAAQVAPAPQAPKQQAKKK